MSDTVERLKIENTFAGYPDTNGSRKQFYNSDAQGRAEYSTVVTDQAGGVKKIISTGYVYAASSETDATNATNKKTIEVTVDVKQVPVTADVLVGSGGLRLNQFSNLSVGNVYVRGQVSMDATSGIGKSNRSVNLNVANYACGDDTNWPQLCTTTPVTTEYIGSYFDGVYGTVCATGQPYPSSYIFPGPTGLGLRQDCVTPPTIMPTFDKKSFIETLNPATKRSGNDFRCGVVGSTITIPANTWIQGDLSLGGNFIGTCRYILEGNLYVEGNLDNSMVSYMQLSDSLGVSRPTIVINGYYKARGAIARNILPNSSGTPAYVVSFASKNPTCSASETVPSLTLSTCLSTAEARSSANLNTGSNAFDCEFAPGGNKNMTGAIFYAYYGVVKCGINGVDFYTVGGQGLFMGLYTDVQLAGEGTEPFGDILTVPSYKIISYRQLY
ncbi:MAG: hypothetical protein EOP51_26450 [Sphingobacteriales bacterium]|nr:MAG: hypothetical protein EOP51_26450 [Sphingobacteriales bacterium]